MPAATPVAQIHRGHLAEIPILAPVGDLGVWSDYPPNED
jgi:hypothetical protein